MPKTKLKNSLLLLFAAAISCLATFAGVQPASAAVLKYSYFTSFVADYYLEREENGDSTLRIVEEITAVFPENSSEHGITRQLVYTGEEDFADHKTLDLKATRNGISENIASIQQVSKSGATYFDIRVGNANREVSGRQVYTLEYTYRNVIDDLGKLQELYWNTNGTGWTKSIQSLTARVHLGEGIEQSFNGDTVCYVGKYGETGSDRCETTKLSDGWQFKTTNKVLAAGENLTFAIGFKAGTFNTSDDGYTLDTKQYLDHRVTGLLVTALILGGGLLFLTYLAYQKASEKRKYHKDYFVKAEYTPPQDFLVAEMAENYMGSAAGDKRVATLMEMAVNHQIEMVKSEKDGLFGKKVPVWKVRIRTDKLKKEQALVLKILAGSNAALHNGQEITVTSHTATSELVNLSKDFTETLQKNLEKGRLLEPTPKKKSKKDKTSDMQAESTTQPKSTTRLASWLVGLGVAWFFIWVFVMIWSFDSDALPNYVVFPGIGILLPLLIVFLLVVTGVLIVVNGSTVKVGQHTMKGLEYSRYMDGLQMYIKMAEADRLKMLQSVKGADTTNSGIVKVYEKLLPYAVVFRLEKSWLEELSRYYELDDVAAPVWYVGMGAFSASDFNSAMTSISSAASTAITSSSSTGGSGGSGGGGFSGGGGGGGGGGTW